jgi:apolipoprotein D and lipocalin family protein
VSFFWPFYGDYWIVELGSNYEYAAVGHPSRDYLWILSRSPTMAPDVYDDLLKRLVEKGFDPKRLVRTPQLPAPDGGATGEAPKAP